ncbi:MAG: hypothetical protein IJX82_01890 [Clostridia bacterium]|nr:hypothetical protein [Clostridia bacterium]
MKKQLLCVLLSLLMIWQTLPVITHADSVTCSPVCEGTNANGNEYIWNWAAPMYSYLAVTAEGMLMRVQWGALEEKLLVEYFNSAYEFQYSLTVEQELPMFGGFHAGTDGCYYVVTGQTNYDEQADVECFRVTKYDSRWNRLGSAGLYDCNTTVPFDAGSLRFAEYGQFLLIRTAHEMYTSSDGLNHQANVTLSLDTLSMTFADTACEVEYSLAGYVSHSFNQFILMDGNQLLGLDHGDAYPRSITLSKATFPIDGTLGIYDELGFYRDLPATYDLFTFPGEIGENYTGACVGGFEYSDSAYIVAFSTVAQDENYYFNRTQNICVATLDKDTEEIRVLPVTDCPEGEESAGVPQLVKLSDNSFLLMWMRGGNLHYVLLNGDGETVGEVRSAPQGAVSDCRPIVIDGKAVWYVYHGNSVTFCEIDGETLELGMYTVDTSHDWQVLEYPTELGGLCHGICKRCGVEESFDTPTRLEFECGYHPTELYYDQDGLLWEGPFEVGTLLYWRVTPTSGVTFTVSDPEGVVLDPVGGTLLCAKEGTYTLTLAYAYNPRLLQKFEISVGHKYEYECDTVCMTCGYVREAGHIPGPLNIWQAPGCFEDGYGAYYCKYCSEKLSEESIPATGHVWDGWYIDSPPTCTEDGVEKRWCRNCTYYETRELPATGHFYDAWYAETYATCTEGGVEKRWCMNCSNYETREIPATGHQHELVVIPPTCYESGSTRYVCYCGDFYVVEETPATGHIYGEWVITAYPTCTEDGREERWCVRYDSCEARQIPATGHTYVEQVILPTCTEGGYTIYTCHCGYTFAGNEVAANGHLFEEWHTDVLGTCTREGLEHSTCSICGAYESRVISAPGHEYICTVIPPTCTEDGYTAYTCHCGDSYVLDIVAARGHDYRYSCDADCEACGQVREVEHTPGDLYVQQPPTCTEDGYGITCCAVCSKTLSRETLSAIGHLYSEWFWGADATCTEDGWDYMFCWNCGVYETRTVPAVGHQYDAWITPPTCTEGGYTTYACYCGDFYTGEETPAVGHTFGAWRTWQAPSCTADGLERRECERCDVYETRTVPAVGHQYDSWITLPTCTEAGYTTYACYCGDFYTGEETPAAGHTFGQWQIWETPACTVDGLERRVCEWCDAYETRTVPAVGHRYDAWITPPTCTEGGYTTYACHCGDFYIGEETPAAGHTFSVWYIWQSPSCTVDGLARRECGYCNTYETQTIFAKGHQYREEVTPPTCTEGGYTTYTCQCGDTYTGEETPATGHTFGQWYSVAPGVEERVCESCGTAETRAKEPQYDVDGNGSVEEADLLLLLSVLVGNTETESLFDLDFDGVLTIYDCVLLAKQL